MNKTYFFWSGGSSKDGVARTYMARLKRIFKVAGIPNGHAHRFRDTFAVELFLSDVPPAIAQTNGTPEAQNSGGR